MELPLAVLSIIVAFAFLFITNLQDRVNKLEKRLNRDK